MEPTVVILAVGDELLSGHTLDTNAHWLAKRLSRQGARLLRKETIPDRPEGIARALRRALKEDRASHVILIGGIGPTPDDRTYAGVAQGLKRPLVLTRKNLRWLERRVRGANYATELLKDNEGREGLVRMVRLPRGSRAIENPLGYALGAWIPIGPAAVIVLPGVPHEFLQMAKDSVLPRLRATRKRTIGELAVWGEEARWYPLLTRIERDHPEVDVGSYPQSARGRIVLRVKGPAASVRRVIRRLKAEGPT